MTIDQLMSSSGATAPTPEKKGRPTGVTVLAILQGLFAILAVLGGLATLTLGSLLGAAVPSVGYAGDLFGLIGIIGLLLGIIGLIITYGMWTGKGWAWWLTIIFSIISIIFNVLSLPVGIIGIIIYLVIVIYLTRPHVKAFFGKGVAA
jgi:hypothetical protein